MRDPLKNFPSGPPWRDRLVATWRKRGWRGFTRVYDLLKPPAGRRELQVRTRYGSQFLITPWDSVDSHVLNEGFYESEVLEAVRPALREPGTVLWVVGANFGLHAITAQFLHPNARVIAFEPSPAMGARLMENNTLNGTRVELHAYALADATAILPFHANESGNPGMSTLHPVAGFQYDTRFHVSATTATDIIAQGIAPPPNALLVDAEGAEEEIFRGLGAHLGSPTLRSVVFEAPNEFLTTGEPTGLRDLIAGAGFRVTKLTRQENTAHSLSNFHATRE